MFLSSPPIFPLSHHVQQTQPIYRHLTELSNPRIQSLIQLPDTLSKTKVTGIQQVDTLQDGVHNLVTGQIGQGGIGQPIGDLASREGINRAERRGKDDKGGYIPEAAGPVAQAGNTVVGGLAKGGEQAAGAVKSGAGSVGGMFGFGGQKK